MHMEQVFTSGRCYLAEGNCNNVRGETVKYLITSSMEQSPYTEQELPQTQHSIDHQDKS